MKFQLDEKLVQRISQFFETKYLQYFELLYFVFDYQQYPIIADFCLFFLLEECHNSVFVWEDWLFDYQASMNIDEGQLQVELKFCLVKDMEVRLYWWHPENRLILRLRWSEEILGISERRKMFQNQTNVQVEEEYRKKRTMVFRGKWFRLCLKTLWCRDGSWCSSCTRARRR